MISGKNPRSRALGRSFAFTVGVSDPGGRKERRGREVATSCLHAALRTSPSQGREDTDSADSFGNRELWFVISILTSSAAAILSSPPKQMAASRRREVCSSTHQSQISIHNLPTESKTHHILSQLAHDSQCSPEDTYVTRQIQLITMSPTSTRQQMYTTVAV